MKKRILIIGANSEVGLCAGKLYLEKGCSVTFAAHKPEELPDWAQPQLTVNLEEVEQTRERLHEIECDVLVYCAGKLASNEDCRDYACADALRKVNFVTPTAILPIFAEKMKVRGSGVLVGISSVAADRGKASHYLYGASKAGFDYYLAGLRQDLHGSGVRVLTIRPGYIHTKMTAGINTPGFLTASKEQVATKLVKNSLQGKRNIVYVKAVWRPIMWIIRHVPEVIFKRLKL